MKRLLMTISLILSCAVPSFGADLITTGAATSSLGFKIFGQTDAGVKGWVDGDSIVTVPLDGQTKFNIATGAGAPNITAGFVDNSVASGTNSRANTISGGGYTGALQIIDGDETRYATIGGGYDNHIDGINSTTDIDGAASTISGGAHHVIQATHSTISGGSYGTIAAGSDYSVIGGGTVQGIAAGANYSTIAGGFTNSIAAAAYKSVISGGGENTVGGQYGVIIGGKSNTTGAGAYSSILGGVNHTTGAGSSATVVGGSGSSATGQGSMAWGRAAVASGRGSVALSTDISSGYGLTISTANVFGAKFDGGYQWYGGSNLFSPATKNGGMHLKTIESSADIPAAESVNIAASIPAAARMVGIQMRVDTALTESWDVAYTGGLTQAITANQPVTKNHKLYKFFDPNVASPITAGTTYVTISRNGGGVFTAGGKISVVLIYEQFNAMSDAP